MVENEQLVVGARAEPRVYPHCQTRPSFSAWTNITPIPVKVYEGSLTYSKCMQMLATRRAMRSGSAVFCFSGVLRSRGDPVYTSIRSTSACCNHPGPLFSISTLKPFHASSKQPIRKRTHIQNGRQISGRRAQSRIRKPRSRCILLIPTRDLLGIA